MKKPVNRKLMHVSKGLLTNVYTHLYLYIQIDTPSMQMYVLRMPT